MKLAFRFAQAFVLVTILVWGAASYFRVEREIALFEHDIRRDHESVGSDLAAAVADIWTYGGESAARAYMDVANSGKSQMRIRLIPVYPPDTTRPIVRTLDSLHAFRSATSDSFVHLVRDSSKVHWLMTYVRVPIETDTTYAIEIKESLQERESYVRVTIIRTIFFTALLGLLAGAIAMVLGVIFVARPVKALVSKARRVAGGELSGRVELRQKDELGELAIELNAMSDRIAEARHQVALESDARRTTVEQLRHAERLTTVGRLASAVAHELGTPLNVVKARGRMIAEGEVVNDEARDSGRIIAGQAERMAVIIRDLLDLSRRRPPHKETIDLGLLVRQTIGLIAPLARKSRVTIAGDLPETPIRVTVDQDQICQVLSNLMVNAVEAMPGGGVMTIAMLVQSTESIEHETDSHEEAVVSITDQGAGIRPEHIPRLFDPFFTTKEGQQGTGLGLSISADIMNEHGGWIGVTSEPGVGSCFTVHLRRAAEEGQ